jgi:hypothetical protein
VAPRSGKGRAFPYKQLPALEIADDFQIPICGGCGDMFIGAAVAKKLDAQLERRYLRLLAQTATLGNSRRGSALNGSVRVMTRS